MNFINTKLVQAVLGVACALLILIGFVSVSGADAKSSAADKINAVNEQMRVALKNCDSHGLSMAFTPDARMIGPGSVIVGREAIEKHMAFVCKIVRDFRIEDQEFSDGGDSVVEIGLLTFLADSGTTIATDRYMTLWKKTDGHWLIHRDISVPVRAAHPEASVSPDLFKIRTTEPAVAVVLPMQGSYEQTDSALARVRDYLVKVGIPPIGAPFGRYFNSPERVPESELRWEAGYFVPLGTGGVADPFRRVDFPAGTIADAVVSGPHKGERPWQQFGAWTVAQGYFPSGPAMERWLDGPRTEMILPVEKTPAR